VNFKVFSLKNITILLIFTCFNWFSEITKWQQLVSKIAPISWLESAIQTLSSSALAMITPIRTGEYGVKILYYKKELRKKIALQAFIGNLYQLLISLGIGAWGLFYLVRYFEETFISWLSLIFLIGICILFVLFIFGNTIPMVKRWFSTFQMRFNFIHQKHYRKAFLLSFLRYCIFSHQFYFLIVLFQIDITYVDAMACITAMYALTSVVPILPAFDFLLKGSVSVMVFSFFKVEPILIIAIASLMWILNFAIPAIIGSYFILTLKSTAK
jgi:hypothetical protein